MIKKYSLINKSKGTKQSNLSTKIKKKLPAIILSIFSLCVSLLLAEFLMRLFYKPGLVLELGEIIPWESYNIHYTPWNNKLGFREEELKDNIFKEDFTRILFLGDSFTFGFGLEKAESLFCELIEKKLNKQREKSTSKYHIFNSALPGAVPGIWLRHLIKLMPHYKPHYVFAVFFLRDGTQLCISLRCHKEIITEIKKKFTDNLFYKYSYIGKYICNILIQREFSNYYIEQIQKAYTGSENDKATWYEQQKFLLKIRDICKQHEIGFHLVIFPMLYGLGSDYRFYSVEDEIVRFADSANIPVFSLTKGFLGHESHTLWISKSDQHPNEKGHRIAADTLYPYLRKVVQSVKKKI